MSSGITQLVAVGAQDQHIIGSPEISFWRSTYKRHTNFAMGVQRQVIQGQPSQGSISSVRLERKGDMLSYMYLTKANGEAITMAQDLPEIEYVDLVIGGQLIDRHYTDYLVKARHLLANTSAKVNPQGLDWDPQENESSKFFPFRFFFCEQWSMALPLVALQYHDVELRIQWGQGVDTSTQYECWANFITLDNDERRQLATKSMELIITQTQRQAAPGGKVANLTFNHPVKYIVGDVSDPYAQVRIQMNGSDLDEMKPITPHFNYVPEFYHATFEPRQVFRGVTAVADQFFEPQTPGTEGLGGFASATQVVVAGDVTTWTGTKLVVKNALGNKTSDELLIDLLVNVPVFDGTYTTFTVPAFADWALFPGGSTVMNDSVFTDTSVNDLRVDMKTMAKFNFFHPFCLDINRAQPTGAVNFSRIDSARIVADRPIWTGHIYAQNYNVLRIQGGQAGVLYAN